MASLTIRDVAAEAGVSKSAVSDILNGDRGALYRPDTVARVQETAERLGYKVNSVARMLRRPTDNLMGMAVQAEFLADPVVNATVAAAQHELRRLGYQSLLVEPAHMVATDSHAAFASPDLLTGILSADWTLEESVPDFYASLKSRLPIVAMYPVKDNVVDCVTADRQLGIEMAVEHLAGLGHRRIAFVGAFNSTSISQAAKVRGRNSAWRKYKLDFRPDYEIALPPNVSSRDPYLADRIASLEPRPTAVVCSGDFGALYLLHHLAKRGINVPQTMSVIGFDGHPGGEISNPPLTTVAQPVQQIARSAVARLLEIRETQREGASWKPCSLLLEPELIVRESTARPS